MTTKTRALIVVALLSLSAGTLFGPRILASWAPALEYQAQANPAERAVTVPEETGRADLIVRARVVSLENRVLTQVLPVYAEDAVTVIDKRESSTPFTDATLEILETLKGKSEPFITVLQTGGTLRKGRFGRTRKFEITEDPIFKEGSEHILFLVDITGDGVHSTGRQLYRVVNPTGRYEIRADGSLRAPRLEKDLALLSPLPQTLGELRRQINGALSARGSDGPGVR